MNDLAVFTPEILKAGRRYSRLVPAGADLSWAQEKLFVLGLLDKSDSLKACTPESIADAVLQAGSMGLSFNPSLKQVYLIPRKESFRRKGENESWTAFNKLRANLRTYAYASPSYLGMTHLCLSRGGFRAIESQIVHEKDVFEYYGVGKEPLFKMARGNRGAIEGVYIIGRLATGETLSDWMDVATVEKIRACSDAPDSLMWKEFYEEGMKKAIVRRSLKLWPKSQIVAEAVEYLNVHEGMGETIDADAIPEAPVDRLNKDQVLLIESKLSDAGFSTDKWTSKIAQAYRETVLADIPSAEFESVMARVDKAIAAKQSKLS